jgi:hypothetical protein
MSENIVFVNGGWYTYSSVASRTNAVLELNGEVIVATTWTRGNKIMDFRPANWKEARAARRNNSLTLLTELPLVTYRALPRIQSQRLWLLHGPELSPDLNRRSGWIITLGNGSGGLMKISLRQVLNRTRPGASQDPLTADLTFGYSTTWDPNGEAWLGFNQKSGLLSYLEFQPLQ